MSDIETLISSVGNGASLANSWVQRVLSLVVLNECNVFLLLFKIGFDLKAVDPQVVSKVEVTMKKKKFCLFYHQINLKISNENSQ